LRTKTKDLRQQPDKFKPSYVIEGGARDGDDVPRDAELCAKPELQETLRTLYNDVEKAFDGQADRTNEILDCWDIYRCQLGPKQFYNGNSKLFLPLVTNAINARRTRFTNQLFPSSQRNIEGITEDGQNPNAIIALLEHYVRKNRLATQLVAPLIVNGDVEGQYTVYVSWAENHRDVVYKQLKPLEVQLAEEKLELEVPGEHVEDIVEEEVVHRFPTAEVLADADFVVFPATSNSIEEALESGGGCAIIRRWSKAKIRQLIEDGEIDEDAGKAMVETMSDKANETQKRDTAKQLADSAGIKKDARGTFCLVYEVWVKLSYKGKRRIYRCYFGGPEIFLGCKRNPWWSDKLPIISCPVEKVAGVFKGKSKITYGLADLQILANDAVNEGMDSAAYALMPIVMTDPEKNPRYASMVMALAAVWETSPTDTQFAQFPALWKDAFGIISEAKQEIFQTLSVSPANIPQGSGKKKLNQAEVAQEQQVDILTTADAVRVLEEGILTPLLQRWLELDHQHRDDVMLVKQYGELGADVALQRIEPIQFHRRWELRWFGVESARIAAQIQQQISAINVVRGVPPNFYEGYKLSLVDPIRQLIENVFGARLAPRIFIDMRKQMSKDATTENMEMLGGEMIMPSPMDNHQMHLLQHQRAIQEMGDPHRTLELHMMQHQHMMQMQMQQAMQQQQGGNPGAPGGQGQPGLPGQGAQAQGPRQGPQQPNGAIHPDQMAAAGSPMMPRRAQ
jgi:hypothetical protein